MSKKLLFTALIGISVFAGCCNNRKRTSPIAPAATEKESVREFPSAQIPGMVTDPTERLGYMADHLWDGFFDASDVWLNDSTHINGVEKDKLEEQMAIYATLLANIPIEKAKSSISGLFDKVVENEKRDTASDVLSKMSAMVTKYFYEPNSPLRNEDIYLPYVQKLATCEMVSEGMRQAYGYDAKMCALNSVGTLAADFAFTTLEGKKMSLYGIKSAYTILFFSNPGCQACKDIIDGLDSNPKITDLLKGGILAIANIYIDRELNEWRKYAGIYPKEWYNGYDHNYIIRTDQIYNVRAIPSVYLLDKDKRVILKDVNPETLFSWLDNLEI